MGKQKPFPSSTESIHRTHCPFLHRHWHLCSPRFIRQPPLTRQPQPNHNPTAIFHVNQKRFTANQNNKEQRKKLNQKHNLAAIFVMYHNQNDFVHSKSEQEKKIQAETSSFHSAWKLKKKLEPKRRRFTLFRGLTRGKYHFPSALMFAPGQTPKPREMTTFRL